MEAKYLTYTIQKHISSENGFPQNTIRDLYFSPSGFLWVATENGMVRYDGKTLLLYNTSNADIKKNRICQFVPMRNGKLYCVTEGENISEIFETNNHVQIQFIKQNKFVGFSSYHLFSPTSFEQFCKICNSLLPENYAETNKSSTLILNKKKHVAQRNSKGIVIFNEKIEPVLSIPITNVEDLDFFISNDELYSRSSNNQFFHINTYSGKMTKCWAQSNLRPCPSSQEKNINNSKFFWDFKTNSSFLVLNNTLFEIRGNKDSIFMETRISQLEKPAINVITYSPDKLFLFVGSVNNGLFIYRKKVFEIMTSESSDNAFYTQAYSPKRKSIYTTLPLLEFKNHGKSKVLSNVEPNKQSIYLDESGKLWYAHGSLIYVYNTISKKNSLVTTIPQTENDGIGFITKKDSNSLFISSNHTLFCFTPNLGLQKIGNYTSKTPIQRAYAIQKYTDSVMLIATDVGIFSYNTISSSICLSHLAGYNVRTLYKAKNGILLAGTYDKGYYVIQPNGSIPIPLDKAGNLKSTHCFFEDDTGFIWMSSNNGLYKVALKEIEHYITDRKNTTLYYYRYSNSDGLLTNEFNGGCFPAAIQLDSGNWSLPSMNGLVKFNPNTLYPTFSPNDIFIDKIILNDTLWREPFDKLINIQTHKFKLEFFLSSPNWTDDNNLYFEYQLDPIEPNSRWILLKDNSLPIILQNLTGGMHSLMIRKKSGPAIDDYQQMKISIRVPKRIFEHYWFWPVAGLVSISGIYGLILLSTYWVRKKKERLELLVTEKTIQLQQAINELQQKNITIAESKIILQNENELKSNLLFLLSHDIASPLRFINMFLSGYSNSISENELIDIKLTTQNLEALLDNIVAWIKHTLKKNAQPNLQLVNIHEIVNNKINLFSVPIKKKENTVINSIPVNTCLHTDSFILSMAIQNLLGNAIHHTRKGIIEIEFKQKSNSVEISITDNGSGVKINSNLQSKQDPNSEKLSGYGIGLKISSELLKIINGKISLYPSINDIGTNAIIYLYSSKIQ